MSDDAKGAPTDSTEESKDASAEAKSKSTEEKSKSTQAAKATKAAKAEGAAKAEDKAEAKPKRKPRKKKSDEAPISQATPPIIRRKKSTAPPSESADAAGGAAAGGAAAGGAAAGGAAAGGAAAGGAAAGGAAAGGDSAEAPPKSAGATSADSSSSAAEGGPKADAAKTDAANADAASAGGTGGAGGADGAAGADAAEGGGVSPNVKAAARMGPAARLAAEAAAKKAALGEEIVNDDTRNVTVTAADLEAEAQNVEPPPRARKKRAGRTTEVDRSAEAETSEAGDGASSGGADAATAADGDGKPAPRKSRERGDRPERKDRKDRRERKDRPERRGERRDGRGRDRGRKKARDADGVAAIGQTTKGRIYRQDLAPDVAAAKAEAAKKAAEEERKRKEKEERDKITLILHPAPKASKARKKKAQDRPRTAKEALKAKVKGAKGAKGTKTEKSKDASAAPAKNVELQKAWLEADVDSAADALAAAAGAEEALVKAWLDASNAGALARAATIDSLPGKARKAARRALNVLKSRGVELPKIESSAATTDTTPEEPVAMFIPPDASGATFFSISQRQRGGRYHVVDIVLRSSVGVVHANSAKLAGKHIKGWLSRVEEQYGTKPVQVPITWARHLIAEGRKKNDVSKQLVPLGFDSCLPLLEPIPEDPPDHPLADLLAEEAGKPEVEKAVADSEALHREPEFAGWLPDRGALDELLAKVGERVGPDGVKDPEVVDEAIRAEVAAATDRWFTPERRADLANSMNDCAISLRARRGDDTAQHVVAVARAVRDAGLITSPPSEIPFLLHFFQKAVAYLVQQNQGQLRVPIPAQPQ